MFTIGTTVALVDASGRDIGSVRVDEVTALWVGGDFTPGPDFPEVEPLFREFEQMVNDQSLSLIDPVMDAIGQLGIRTAGGTQLRDVQIYPAEGGAGWRPPGYEP